MLQAIASDRGARVCQAQHAGSGGLWLHLCLPQVWVLGSIAGTGVCLIPEPMTKVRLVYSGSEGPANSGTCEIRLLPGARHCLMRIAISVLA